MFELVTGIPHCDARVYALKHFDIVFRVAECECVVYVSAAAIEIFFNSAGFVDSARRNLPACIAEIAEAVSDNIEFIAYILLQLGKINTRIVIYQLFNIAPAAGVSSITVSPKSVSKSSLVYPSLLKSESVRSTHHFLDTRKFCVCR